MKKNNSEFSHIIDIGEITDKGEKIILTATAAQCAALAERLKQKGIKGLTAAIDIRKNYDSYSLTGTAECSVLLADVVSLDEFWQKINTRFSENFKIGTEENNAMFEMDSIFFTSSQLDVAEVAVEYISLEIPSYPRKTEQPFIYREFEESEERSTPFAVLKNRMKKEG